jgi:hypothetical protein
MRKKILPKNHPHTANSMFNLAMVLYKLNKLETACCFLHDCLDIKIQIIPKNVK